ncbi:MAG: hypothetical protein GY790_09590 [Bacteroidetes bacterium]|nr:hypothetical protein [Bacteroidota bacterium]
MAEKAASNQLSFRPHFKTHQSAEIGNWFGEFGVSKITVSSFRMARYFASAGWKDILVAFPFNPHDLHHLNELSVTTKISILLDNPDTLAFLGRLECTVEFYIDIDTGYGRTGIKSGEKEKIEELLAVSGKNPGLKFRGFYCHAGHSYKTFDNSIREQIHLKATGELLDLKQEFATYSPLALYGDTPNCSTQDDFTGIDEISPGNFVFYDLTQILLGTCCPHEVAVAMTCSVTGKYPERKQLVIHGGGVHFSKDSIQFGDRIIFGEVVIPGKEGWRTPGEKNFITGLSQEHGLLENAGSLFNRTRIGDRLMVLPVHSCMTANLMREYRTLNGDVIKTINS